MSRSLALVLAPLLSLPLALGACKSSDAVTDMQQPGASMDAAGVGGMEPTPDLSAVEQPARDLAQPPLVGDLASTAGMEPPAPIEVHTRTTIPARIEAEKYNRFHELTPAVNSGGQCDRNDGVDIESTTDSKGGVCDVGWTDAGEWLEFDIKAGNAGDFDIVARVTSDAAGRSFHINLDGTNLGALSAPTGGWQAWEDRGYQKVRIGAGDHTLRVVFDTGLTNINFVEIKAAAAPPPRDVTFYVVADTHADPPADSYDLRAMSRAINAVAGNGQWPSSIGGSATNFTGGKIAAPQGVVFVGDLTGWGTAPTEITTYRRYFEKGNSDVSINYPGYLGMGNHDIDSADRAAPVADAYRAQYWSWVDSRHKGAGAPVPVGSFDAASHAYSWDFAGVHMIQTHRFPGDAGYGLTSSLGFLKSDLAAHAADGRPVFIFHHYGMDAFGTNGQWWNAADRAAYRDALKGYTISGIITGHTHYAMQYTWESLRVFQVNNAKAEINAGNNDGNGSFAIVRITDSKLDVVTCRWLDDAGHYELIAPFFSGPANPGKAP
jgi:cytolysin (calcineurin-like family phosphatase)